MSLVMCMHIVCLFHGCCTCMFIHICKQFIVCVCSESRQTWAAATGSWQGKQAMTNGSGHDVGECGDSVCVHVYVHVPWYTVSVSVCVNIHKVFKELTPGSETA